MPAPVPVFLLTALLKDIAGNTDDGSKLIVTLCKPTMEPAEIPGYCTLDTLVYVLTAAGGGIVNQLFWGNDVISPIGTFYCVQGIDGEDRVTFCENYRFLGSGTFRLDELTPYDPPAPGPVTVPPLNYVDITGTGTVPGTVYAAPGTVVMVFWNNIPQRPGIDFNVADDGITVTLTFSTSIGDQVYALVVA